MQCFSSYKRPLFITGSFCVFLGVMVIIGYFTGNPVLVRILPNFSCQRFNTALGFVALGLGLFALGTKQKPWVILLSSVLPLVLGTGIIVEYLFGVRVIDSIFLFHPPSNFGCAPDSLAPNTGVCFLICGVSFIVMIISRTGPRLITWILALMGATVVGIGLVVSIAYLGSLEPGQGILNLTGMGLQTAVGFIAFGSLLLMLAYRRETLARGNPPPWFAVPAGVAVATTLGILCQALQHNQSRHIERLIQSELAGVKNEIVARMEARTFSLLRLARSLQSRPNLSDTEFEAEARLLMQHFPGFNFIEWTDKDFSQQSRIATPAANHHDFSTRIDLLSAEKEMVRAAISEHREVLVTPVGGKSDTFLEVVSSPEKSAGKFLVASYRSATLFADILNHSISPGFAIELTDHHNNVFTRDLVRQKFRNEWMESTEVQYDGINWMLSIWPTSDTMADLKSPIVMGTSMASVAMTLLVMATVFFGQKSLARARQAEAFSQQLMEQIRQREIAQASLREAHADLENRVAKRTIDLRIANDNLKKEMSERLKIENELALRAKELARSNSELEQFAYVASHDLQEPLRMITSFLSLLARRYIGKLDQSADEYINFSVEGAKRMKHLIDDLLSYSRVSGAQRNMATLSLDSVVKDVFANLKLTIEESQASIHCESNLPRVRGDRRQLMQLFQNLIANAIKFRGEDPPVVRISAFELNHEWQITVEDNGIGFDMSYSDRIFLIFQRLHSQSKYSGSGIGLAICKRIVEIHGGRIWASSQPNRGSSFSFTLPKVDEEHGYRGQEKDERVVGLPA